MDHKKLHDKLFRRSLNNIDVAKDFIMSHMPKEILAKFDLNTVKFYKNFYIDNDLSQQITDIVYQAKMQDGSCCYLCLLLEHQSTAVKLMPFRLLRYQVAIMADHVEQIRKKQANKEADKLPIVFPILYYAGSEKPYPYTLDILELFNDYKLAEQTLAKPINLVDVNVIPDEVIMQHKLIGLLEFVHKHIRDEDLSLIVNKFKQIIANLTNQYPDDYGIIEYIKSVIYYIITLGNFENSDEFLKQLREDPVIGGKIMGTLARKFEEDGIQKGLQQGMQQGIQRGMQQGKLEQAKSIALKMLRGGMSYIEIEKYTGLTLEQIEDLQNLSVSLQ